MGAMCLICGNNEQEVLKMHYFPKNTVRCKIWFESLGVNYPNMDMRNYRICSNHFNRNDYSNIVTWKLKPHAVPIKFTMVEADPIGVDLEEKHINIYEKEDQLQVEAGPSREVSTVTPKPKRSVFRRIPDISRLSATPRKLKLIKLIESKEAHIRHLKKISKSRGHDLKELVKLTDSNVVKELFQDLPSTVATFLISQVRCSKKVPKGRRWTIEEKVLALALLKRGPKCYSLLRKIVALPSKKTLLELLRHIPFDSGINVHILQHINKSIKEDDDRFCVMVLDEMDIKEHIQYDAYADKIRGFDDIGEGSKAVANKALVFMVKGIKNSWKQPVAYYFSNGAVTGTKLAKIIVEVIKACRDIAKLTVVATINDCGSTNVKALKQLGSSVITPYILIGDQKIFTIFDPPHLLKCTASLFRKHNVDVQVPTCQNAVMLARFNDIRKAHEIDSKSPLIFRAMHKIKNHHMDPKMKYSMKVNLAAQILSRTVSAYLYTLLSRGELEQRSIATATFVQQVDELFDSFNGSSKFPPSGKEVKCKITKDSPPLAYWDKAFKMVRRWRFIRYSKKGLLKNKPPSQIGWLTTIRAVKELWKFLHNEKKFDSLKPRTLNQDAMENLFGGIRSGLGNNDNPTTIQFVGSLKTQILNGLVYLGSGKNCEEDDEVLLSNLNTFLAIDQDSKKSSSETSTASNVFHNVNAEDLTTDIANAVTSGTVATMSVAYVGGFIIKYILRVIDCAICKKNLLSSSDEPHNLFISFKEWDGDEERLIYPAEQPVITVGTGITLLEDFLESHCNIPNISKEIENHLNHTLDFSFIQCPLHMDLVKNSIIKGIWKIGIPWWCKRKVLKMKESIPLTKNKKLQKFTHI